MNQPMIFTVMSFQLRGGTRRLRVHYVAACSSTEAQARITADNRTHLTGQCFITTDEHQAIAGDGCKMYVSEYRSNDVSEADFKSWTRNMVRPSVEAGEAYPAAFRRFHVVGNRKFLADEAARWAA